MSSKEIIQRYYASLNEKDDRWQDLYASEAEFSDPSLTLNAKGKPAVIQSFVTFLRGVESVKVKQMIVEGENACAIIGYEYINPNGKKMSQDVAEVWVVKNEKLAKLTIYFDLTAYRSFMRG